MVIFELSILLHSMTFSITRHRYNSRFRLQICIYLTFEFALNSLGYAFKGQQLSLFFTRIPIYYFYSNQRTSSLLTFCLYYYILILYTLHRFLTVLCVLIYKTQILIKHNNSFLLHFLTKT